MKACERANVRATALHPCPLFEALFVASSALVGRGPDGGGGNACQYRGSGHKPTLVDVAPVTDLGDLDGRFICALACLGGDHAGLGWHLLFVWPSVERFVEHPAVEGRTIVDALQREEGWGDVYVAGR